MGIPRDANTRASSVRELLWLEPSHRVTAEIIECLEKYEPSVGEARRVGQQWSWFPLAMLAGAALGGLIASDALPVVRTLGRADWVAIATTFFVWCATIWMVRPSDRREEPGGDAWRLARNLLIGAVLLVGLAVANRLFGGVEPLVAGLVLGLLTSSLLLPAFAFAFFYRLWLPRHHLRARHRREHAVALLVGLISAGERGIPLAGRREWQDSMTWGIEELAKTVRSARDDIPAVRDANTIRWIEAETARQAEGVRRWKQQVIHPRGMRPALPLPEMRHALRCVALGRWGDLVAPTDVQPPLGFREYAAFTFSALLGVGTYYLAAEFSRFLQETWTVGEQLQPLFSFLCPLSGFLVAIATAPPAVTRALLEALGTAKAIRDWGGK